MCIGQLAELAHKWQETEYSDAMLLLGHACMGGDGSSGPPLAQLIVLTVCVRHGAQVAWK